MVDPEKVKLAAELTIKFFDSAKVESDRGVVLIVVSILDKLLGEVHQEYIAKHAGNSARAVYTKLAEQSGPFSTFSGKIEIAYCYGLIGKVEHADLTTIRKLRNRVAHDLAKFAFTDSDVEALVSKLQIEEIAKGISEFPLPSMEVVDLICSSMAQTLAKAPAGTYRSRARFIACGMLLHALLQKRKAHLPSETSSRDFVRPWENEPGALPCEKTEEWFDTFWGNVLAETDRGVVLVIAMVLDECVDRIHQAHLLRNFDNPERQFKKLSSQSGPLGSLASRVLLAVGFGLINDFIFYQLELIRVLRNYLAHESGMFSFASAGAIELVSKMRYDEMKKMVNSITSNQTKDPATTEVMRDFALKCAARHQRIKLVESDAPLDAASTFILCGLSLNMLLWNRETDLKIHALRVRKIL